IVLQLFGGLRCLRIVVLELILEALQVFHGRFARRALAVIVLGRRGTLGLFGRRVLGVALGLGLRIHRLILGLRGGTLFLLGVRAGVLDEGFLRRFFVALGLGGLALAVGAGWLLARGRVGLGLGLALFLGELIGAARF